jgi:hypothetical protein
MQSVPSIARALYRIVFRGGTPQRIQFSTALMLSAIGITLITTIFSGRFFFSLSTIEIGLLLFTLLTGLYIGAALLTRSVPRVRLRASLLTVLLLLGSAGVVFVLLIPLREMDTRVVWVSTIPVGLAVFSGVTNSIQYAKAVSRANAAVYTIAFTALLVAFYATLAWLLETVFS